MRAAPCPYRPARLLCRRDRASNHRGLADRSGVALHVQQVPAVPRRQRRHARIHGPADDFFPSKFAIGPIHRHVDVTLSRPCVLSSSLRSSSEPDLYRTTVGTTRHGSLRPCSLVILVSRFLSRLFSLVCCCSRLFAVHPATRMPTKPRARLSSARPRAPNAACSRKTERY